MAQESRDKNRKVDEEGEGESSSETSDATEEKSEGAGEGEGSTALARTEGGEAVEGDEGEQGATQLGTDRYVLSGFFAAALIGAYVLGKALQTVWISASNKDWFAQSLPFLAAVSDDDKGLYGIILGGLLSIIFVFRTFKKPGVRTWADDVATELQKVVWPTRKDVVNYTFIVILASGIATVYLMLLDRLWAFVTNIVYGDGS